MHFPLQFELICVRGFQRKLVILEVSIYWFFWISIYWWANEFWWAFNFIFIYVEFENIHSVPILSIFVRAPGMLVIKITGFSIIALSLTGRKKHNICVERDTRQAAFPIENSLYLIMHFEIIFYFYALLRYERYMTRTLLWVIRKEKGHIGLGEGMEAGIHHLNIR